MKNKILSSAYFGALLISLIVFYTVFYPLILESPDDWRYINYWRDHAIPMLGRGWNPGRVLPETLMPIAAKAGIILMKPFGVGFVRSVAIGLGVCVSLFVCVYVYSFWLLLRDYLEIDGLKSGIISTFFILCHFGMFRSAQSDNTYLLDGKSPNTYFFYIIPYVLNFTIVFMWIRCKKKGSFEQWTVVQKALWIVAVYFAVFSNLFSSIVIASFATLSILDTVIKHRKTKLTGELAVLALWIYSVLAEFMGGRSNSITGDKEINIFANIKETIKCSLELFGRFNKYFLLLSFAVIACAIALYAVKLGGWSAGAHLFVTSCILALVIFIYQILLCSVVGPKYIARAMISATYLVFLLVMDSVALSFILVQYEKVQQLSLLFLIIIASMIGTTQPIYTMPTIGYSKLEKLDEYYIETVCEADFNGEDEAVIETPEWLENKLSDSDGLYSTYIGSTLYKYGFTSKQMKIVFR